MIYVIITDKLGYIADYFFYLFSMSHRPHRPLSTAAKKCIPRGRRSNHIPCWDAECEDLYQHFLQSPWGPDSDRAATALLTRLDGSGEIAGQRRSATLTFLTPAGWHGIL